MEKFLTIILLTICSSTFAQNTKLASDTLQKDSLSYIKQIQEVTVLGRRKAIERKIDRTVINVGSFITSSGSNVFDFLGQLPGMKVNEDGGINLMGKGATVYLDGRPTYLSGRDLISYLKSLPTDFLDRIELMPQPPSKFDAAGSGGIIHIITKKNKVEGFNVGLSGDIGKGRYRKRNGSLNLNYRVNKINLFANLGIGNPKEFITSRSVRRILNSELAPISIIDQKGEMVSTRNNNLIKLGVDYYLNKKTTLGIIYTNSRNFENEVGATTNRALNPSGKVDSIILSNNTVDNKFYNRLFNLNLNHQFDSLGTEISVDLDYGAYKTSTEQKFNNINYIGDNLTKSDYLSGVLPRFINIYSAKTDFVLPVSKGFKINTGVKISKVKTDNIAEYFTGEEYNEKNAQSLSNRFLYNEIIQSGYLESYKDFGKVGMQAGMRVEKTISNGHQKGNNLKDSLFRRNYVNVFPTFFISFKPDSTNKNQFFLALGRRVNRPSYNSLNPFYSSVQRYEQVIGNPFLEPEFTNNIEITHVFKEKLNSALYLSSVNNITTSVVRSSNDVYIRRPENTGNLKLIGLMMTYNQNLFKWWNSDFSINPERVHLNILINNNRIDTLFFAFSFNWFNRFIINKKLMGEIVLNTGSSTFTGQNSTKGIASLRAGLKYQLLNDNGSISISGNDLFYSVKNKGRIYNVYGSDTYFEDQRDTRTIMVSFNYRFGRNNKNLRDRNGTRDEQERVKFKP